MPTRLRSRVALLLLPVLAFGLARCGDESSKEPSSGTPYAEGDASGAQTGYAESVGREGAKLASDLAARAGAALEKARAYVADQQTETGGWGVPGQDSDVGITGMATAALVAATPAVGVAADERIKSALTWMQGNQKDDGSIFNNPRYVNYMTSAATGAFALAKISAFAKTELEARKFLASTQISGDESDLSYGGFPYKQDQGQVSDLSNLQFAAQALHDAGLPPDSPVWERMRVYLDRVQNRSESNDLEREVEHEGEQVVVVAGDDGGAGYSPGTSKAGLVQRSDGSFEPRSYGSMTYALLKSMLFAGVDVKDPRVQDAIGWISRNFTVERNPGFEASADPEQESLQGYYYYLYTMARALAEVERATGEKLVVVDAEGVEHDWRAELVTALLERQQDDGSWVNEVDRWMEGLPILATSYATVAMAEAMGRFD